MTDNPTTTEPGPAVATHNQDQALMYLVNQVRKGATSGRNLSIDDRRACVAYLTAEGYSVYEIAVLLGVCERSIVRDRAAVRQDVALQPSERLGDEILGELRRRAEMAISQLNRAVRETGDGPKINPHHRIRAALHGFYVYNKLATTLLRARYFQTGDARLNMETLRNLDPDNDPLDALMKRALGPATRNQ